MRAVARVVWTAGVLFLLLHPPPGQAADTTAPVPAAADLGAAVDAIFARYTADTPGCAVGVSKDGKEVLSRAYGSADLEHGIANTPDTIFEAGSVSKQFTAAAILLLAQAGKLKLTNTDMNVGTVHVPPYGTQCNGSTATNDPVNRSCTSSSSC